MGPESTGSNQQSASALSPQQVIDSSAKSNSVTQTNLTQSTPSPIGSSSGSQGNARVGDAKDVCSSTTDKNKNLNYVIQSQQQEARLASQQYQYQPKRSTVQPDHNQNHQQQQHHHQHLQAQESTYLASNQSHYYSCRTCGNQRPLCKCNSNQEIVSADSLSANFGSFSSAEAGSNQNQTAAGRQMGDRYQVDGSSSHNHRSTPHSSSTSSSSSISAALTTSGNANTITMIEHNYEQGGFKNHLQQQHQHDHNPHQQHTVHHHHHHNNNQYAHSQQVSSQADHHHHLHHQHPQLISGADALLASENHSHQLTYNYDEQDHQECGDSWATLALDSAGYHSENCSSHINHQNDHHHLSHQTNHANEHSMFDESSLRPGGVDLLGSADHQQQQHHHQQQQLIAPPSQQTYSHHTSLHKMAPPGGNSNDLSTKQSQRHHGATYSTLVPMPTANHHQHHHYQPMHEAYLCGQAESRDNGSENMYSTSDASNYYSDSSACNDPASYHDSSRNQHLHQDGYPTNQSATRFEMMAATTTTSNQQLHPSRQVQHHSPTLNSMSTQQQQQQQSTHLSSSSSYDHLQQLEQMQSYQQDQHRSQLKHSMSVDQFHNEHYSQQQQLYHTGTSQALIENNNHDQEQNAYKSLASVNDSGSCGEQPIQFSQQQDNQYPSSDLKTQSSNYSSLQQLTMNYDNHLNQVTTTTVSTDRTLLSASKGRTLKGRRGRPRKKGLRSKNKVNGKLWEFIRDLLLSDCTNPSFIRWERREDGVFKFVQSDKVAKMWGERKQNPKMTYEKLSRAMRYYYKSKVLLPVFGRRLVYKFGPNATGWLPEDNNNAHVF